MKNSALLTIAMFVWVAFAFVDLLVFRNGFIVQVDLIIITILLSSSCICSTIEESKQKC